DPGHPSENGIGTKGKKVTEVGVAWQVGLHLSKLLKQAGYKVILTKNSERQMIKNAARAKIANEGKADLLLRLHCDAGTGSGLATFYPRETGTIGKISGPALSVRKASEKIALVFHPAVIKSLAGKLADSGLKTDRKTKIGAKQGALTGSILSQVPVVLVEMCVLQNAHDEAFIATLSGQQAMAKALFAGVKASVPRNRK
ncbi:MAG: N-acetylmuramoyl-L-alanine amidase, partial [Fimbriimonadaceae bacterium]